LSNTTLQGWGRGTWSEGAWNTFLPVSVTGVAGTTAVGNETATPGQTATPSGVSATAILSATSSTTITFTVTVVSGNPSNHPYYNQGSTNKYAINGSTATSDVTLALFEGNTYRFDQSDSSNSGHPLRLYEAADKTGGEYTTGVTTNGTPGSSGAYTEITVAHGAPTLHYQCSNHALMGYTANTPSAVAISTTTGAPVTTNVGTTAVGSSTVVIAVETAVTLSGMTLSQGSVAIIPQGVVFIEGIGATGSVGPEQVYSLIRPDQVANWTEEAA